MMSKVLPCKVSDRGWPGRPGTLPRVWDEQCHHLKLECVLRGHGGFGHPADEGAGSANVKLNQMVAELSLGNVVISLRTSSKNL